MITRLDDELHARLKARAAAEGRSLNDLIVEALNTLVHEPLTREVVRERLRARGTLVEPESPNPRPGPSVWQDQPGAGRAVLEALLADREEGW